MGRAIGRKRKGTLFREQRLYFGPALQCSCYGAGHPNGANPPAAGSRRSLSACPRPCLPPAPLLQRSEIPGSDRPQPCREEIPTQLTKNNSKNRMQPWQSFYRQVSFKIKAINYCCFFQYQTHSCPPNNVEFSSFYTAVGTKILLR